MPVYARTRAAPRKTRTKPGGPQSPPSAEPPRHAAQRHAHSKHTPPTRCEPEDRTTHHQRAKLRRNGGLVSHLSFLPSTEKYFFPDHEVIPASYLGNLVSRHVKQLFGSHRTVESAFLPALPKRKAARRTRKRGSPQCCGRLRFLPNFFSRRLHSYRRRTPNASPSPLSPHLCLSCIFVCAYIALPPQLLRSSPRAPSSAPASPDRLALVPQNTCSDANSIWYSHAVTHHGTNQTRRGLNAGS